MSQRDEFDEKAHDLLHKLWGTDGVTLQVMNALFPAIAAFGRECAREARAKAFEEAAVYCEQEGLWGAKERAKVLRAMARANPPSPKSPEAP